MRVRFEGNTADGYVCHGYWPDRESPRIEMAGPLCPTVDDALEAFWDLCAVRLCELEEIKALVFVDLRTQLDLARRDLRTQLELARRDSAEPPVGFLGC